MTYALGLLAALGGFWFALSGQTSPFFVGVAVISVIATMWLSARLKVIDRDGSPYHRAPQLLLYLGWLMVEIVKANVAVIARVIGPSHAIDPAMVEVKSSAKSSLGRALFANSITLTPGTVTVDVVGATLKVHALVRENASAESFDEMDRKSARTADARRAAPSGSDRS
jgi:multicomponent Na+:H+ antiporter subunit E